MKAPSGIHVDVHSSLQKTIEAIAKTWSPRTNAQQNRTTELCLFVPLIGNAFATGSRMMVIGRAVNGWADDVPFTAERLGTEIDAGELIDEVDEAHETSDGCPMTWVIDCEGARTSANGKVLYNTNASAFWRVARGVMQGLSGNEMMDRWSSALAWSNLYKISPLSGGNPSSSLCNAQLKTARRCLATEVECIQPKSILFLTGFDWAQPFLDTEHWHIQKCNDCQLIQAHGTFETDGHRSSVVVGPHPQGKREGVIVEESLRLYAGGC